ncbi:MAG: glycosyltransferase family 4 protein [Cellvibrionaceae bacterium]
MKIAHVITRADEIGGAQVHLRDLSERLKGFGHSNIIIAGGSGAFFDSLSVMGISHIPLKYLVRPISFFSDVKAIFELVKILKKIDPDIVTAHSFKAGFVTRLACVLFIRKKCIFTAHGWSFIKCASPKMKFIYILIEKLLSSCSYKTITVCEADRYFAIYSRITSEEKIAMIYNGIPDVDHFLRAHHKNLVPKIIMVARFDWPKDHMILIEALNELRNLSWSLELVGEGPHIKRIKTAVQTLNLTGRISFLGRRDDIPELLSQSDMFVLTSHAEGFPISILEAMRASLPVIATNTGGVPEAVIDRETGFVVEDLDCKGLKENLFQLLSNIEMRAQMGLAGRNRYMKLFTDTAMVADTIAVYEEAVQVNVKTKK